MSRLLLSVLILQLVPCVALADISFTNGAWRTSFNYPISFYTQRGAPNGSNPSCASYQNDGITWDWGAVPVGTNYSQATSAANNPLGDGNGARFWVGDGVNVQSGSIKVAFPSPQKELWIRWYQRYEQGFAWSHLDYDKTLYLRAGDSGTQVIPEFHSNDYVLIAQGTPAYYQVQTNDFGWNDVMGGSVSDGKFHCYEIHLKMDTNGANGVGQLWIDGVLRASNLAVNWSAGNTVARQGWTWFSFHNNQKSPGNGKTVYVDYDDMVIFASTPPNVDAEGNPFIGPEEGPPASDSGVTPRDGSVADSAVPTDSAVPADSALDRADSASSADGPQLVADGATAVFDDVGPDALPDTVAGADGAAHASLKSGCGCLAAGEAAGPLPWLALALLLFCRRGRRASGRL